MKKGLIKNLLPDYKFAKVTEISRDFFEGAKLIIFDVDNTLVFPETVKIEKEVLDWFSQIIKNYNCVLLSNSPTIKERKEKISESLGCELFLSRWKKPFKRFFKEIENKFSLKNNKIFVVGDRILTDILFGNRNDAVTILVKPLSREEESLFIKFIRTLESLILSVLKFFGYN